MPWEIDNYETHIVPVIADIDAGFGNEEATYLLAKKMIEAGACALQIENQVADEKQCGHQDGKVTVPHADFHSKIRALRYAFLELEQARSQTLRTNQFAVTADQYIAIWSFAHYYEQSRERYSRRLLQIAERDSLTGLLNRMRLAEVVDSEIRNAETRGQTMAMILLDLDHFKQVNDCHGHPAGDHALIYVADCDTETGGQ